MAVQNDEVRKDLGSATAYAYAVDKGYTGTEEEFAELMARQATIAQETVDQALKAEGYAVGAQDGTNVTSGSPYYHNNSKYYSEQAGSSAGNASDSASAASGSANTASAKALVAEGWAQGKQNGQAVASGSPYYHKDAAYLADQASQSATAASESASAAQADREHVDAVAETIPEDFTELEADVSDLKSALTLQEENIPGTVMSIVYGSDGRVSQIKHCTTGTTTAVRTDAFTYADGSITEVRTLATGESLTIVSDLENLTETTTYAPAA